MKNKLIFYISALLIAVGIIFFHFHEERIFILAPMFVALLKSFATIIAVLTALAGIWAFTAEHIPNVKVLGATMNEKNTLVAIVIKNYSKTSVSNMVIRSFIFECKIIDDKESTVKDISNNWFSHMPAKQRFMLAPDGTDQIFINLNLLKTRQTDKPNISIFKDHIYILVYLQYEVPFLPVTIKERSVLYYDQENQRWFVASLHHQEMRNLFKVFLNFLEKDNLNGLIEYLSSGKRRDKEASVKISPSE